MTYQLPDSYWRSTGPADRPPVKEFTLYTAEQMQAAYQAGEDRLRALLTSQSSAYDSGYQAGRESMRQECVKVCEEFDIPDRVEGAHPDYVTGKRMAAVQVSYKIKELK